MHIEAKQSAAIEIFLPLTAAVRNKGTSGRNCIKYGVEFHYEQYKANISKQLVFSSMQIREIFILLFKFYIIQDISLLTTTKPAFNYLKYT
ncbi:hypothetical protein T4D_13412 [Trichinella pseudospiralis]|uniref:Uncharacterized protein n=1 Tax=Trichinella pseudospiralis TaxID=6337 RepID=A0A0V1FIN5_TRIPS|nr:hypothetical protein T4D_10925 [Trichinella pseudospiralis]KRY85952.1 hypothetical protein T4D_13412 [Trichinella pseudospiralis]